MPKACLSLNVSFVRFPTDVGLNLCSLARHPLVNPSRIAKPESCLVRDPVFPNLQTSASLATCKTVGAAAVNTVLQLTMHHSLCTCT